MVPILEYFLVELMHLKLQNIINYDIKLVIHLIKELIKLQEFSRHNAGSPGYEFVDLFLDFGNHLTLIEVFVKAILLILCNKLCHTIPNSIQLVVGNLDFLLQF